MDLVDRFLAGDRRALARAISWVENGLPESAELLRAVWSRSGQARITGITGPPGAGKSTLVDRLAAELRGRGAKVGIIAVDPSSPFSGGAILGDRIRMQRTLADPGVFMRSLASRGHLGGLSRATAEVVALMDAFGFDHVLVETVGAGQSEVEIMELAQTTVVVLVPGMGDDVQAIKAGILEIGDVFAVNKADRDGAERTAADVEMMLDLAYMGSPGVTRWPDAAGGADAVGSVPAPDAAYWQRLDRAGHHGASQPAASPALTAMATSRVCGRGRHGSAQPGGISWRPPIVMTVARDGRGVAELAGRLEQHGAFLRESGHWERHRQQEALEQVTALVRERVLERLLTRAAGPLAAAADRVAERSTDPYSAAEEVLLGLGDSLRVNGIE